MKSILAPDYIVGTDGLCKNNQAAGGQKGTWAFMVMSNLTKEIKGGMSGSNPANRKTPASAREALDRAFDQYGL